MRRVAEVVKENLRKTDVVGRWGGEEFVVLLPGSDSEEAKAVAEKLRKRLEALGMGSKVRITASFGVAELKDGDDPLRLILKADKALYTAKRRGKNRVESYMDKIPLK